MAVENDFLPFAVGPGANVLSQSAYAALSSVSTGYIAGVAQSAALNKTWRQSSIMAAVMAQFIVAQTGQTAIDDGTTATLLANFTTAVVAASKQRVILSDSGVANAYAASNAVPMSALPTATGAAQTVQIANSNTGASTYAPDGLAAKPIFGLGGAALQGGELKVGGIATLVSYVGPLLNGGSLCWVLYECLGGAQQVPPATASQHAAQFGQLQSGSASYAVATGSANAHTIALSPALTSRADGMMLRYKAPAANTGAVTLADGVGTASVVGANHAALQGGEYIANGDALVVWNSTINGGTYILLECTGGALQVAAATQSQHAMQLGQATGRWISRVIYAAAGTYTATPPSNATLAVYDVTGGGGGGGGGQGTSTGQISAGAGGGAGGRAIKRVANPTAQTVTVGVGGANGTTSANGGNGGTSSVGAIVSATGGTGGQYGTAGTGGTGSGAFGGAGTGGDVNINGANGYGPFGIASIPIVKSGMGANSSYGAGGMEQAIYATGGNATGNGSGGAGGCTPPSNSGGSSGGAGAAGIVIIDYYS